MEEIYKLAVEKGYTGNKTLPELEWWLREKKLLHCEIFFSMFHKKWALNNYLIDLKKFKKIELEGKAINYETYSEALLTAIEKMLNKIQMKELSFETIEKVCKFRDAMLDQLENNLYKGSILDFNKVDQIIAELEYHKAKALLAVRVSNKHALKEYIADTANFLFALGNIGGLYNKDFNDVEKSFEINKEVEIFIQVDSPSLNQKIDNL